jgi:ribosomal protein S18 acetylase RimI-like enzyme
MKCKVVEQNKGEQSKTITSYGYFDGDKKIAHCSMRLKTRGDDMGTYTLQNVLIIPEYRGKGLCTKFLECVLKKYSDKTVFLDVLINNEPAVRCYTKLGFKEVERGRSSMWMRKN